MELNWRNTTFIYIRVIYPEEFEVCKTFPKLFYLLCLQNTAKKKITFQLICVTHHKSLFKI